jgi:hypothetical protein
VLVGRAGRDEPSRLVSGLLERAEAARELLRRDGTVDRLLVLSFVLWPSQAVAEAAPSRGRRTVTDAEVERMAELARRGLSHRQIGERLGRPRSTVSDALRTFPRYAPGYARDAHSRHPWHT